MISNLHTFLTTTLYGYLPAAVKAVISNKRTLMEYRYSASGALTDGTSWGWQDLGPLWVPLEYEVFGSTIWGTKGWSQGQGVQYPIFANSFLNRIKGAGNGGGRCYWWTASVGSGDSAHWASPATGPPTPGTPATSFTSRSASELTRRKPRHNFKIRLPRVAG